MDNLIVTVAVIGAGPTREQSEYIPISPAEIADLAIQSFYARHNVIKRCAYRASEQSRPRRDEGEE
jgi:uncharacterized protein (DUF849 family)